MVAMLMVASTAMVATSCGDDDDVPASPVVEKTVKESKLRVSLYVNQTVAETYDVRGNCLGQEITLSSTPTDVSFQGTTTPMYTMTLEGTGNTLPLSAIMNVSFTLKEGYQVPDKSDFAIAVNATGTISYTDGTALPYTAQGFELYNKGVFASKITEYTDNLNAKLGRIKATLDSNGIEIDTSADE